MPDLPGELRAMLHDRAELAPPAPAPARSLARRVRRRQSARLAAAVGGPVLAVVAVAGIATSALRPAERSIEPGRPGTDPWAFLETDDRYEFCDPPTENPDILVSVHRSEDKFAQGCVTARASAPMIQFSNGQDRPHDLQVRDEGGTVAFSFPAAPNISYADRIALAAGDYQLVCTLHETMRAQLVVR